MVVSNERVITSYNNYQKTDSHEVEITIVDFRFEDPARIKTRRIEENYATYRYKASRSKGKI